VKIADLKNNCCLVAMHLLSDHTDEDILAACYRVPGWKPGRGMRLSQSSEACTWLGIRLEHVPLSRYFTLAQFCKEHEDGTYWVTVNGHALVVHDGKILDPNFARSGRGSRRRVIRAHRCLNPGSRLPEPIVMNKKLPSDPLVRFVATVQQARQRNTRGFSIYWNCLLHLRDIEEGYCHLSDLEVYGYTRKMFRADRRRGFVVIA